jgi:hypothetical protein
VRLLVGMALLCAGVPGLVSCGADESKDETAAERSGMSGSADESICRADASAINEPYSDSFPTSWAFPPDTTAYHVEEQGSTGTIVTAVSEAPFDDVLTFLNNDEVEAGFEISDGETEEDDAEANWTSEDFRGRWTIRKSADCPGETVIQVLAVPLS